MDDIRFNVEKEKYGIQDKIIHRYQKCLKKAVIECKILIKISQEDINRNMSIMSHDEFDHYRKMQKTIEEYLIKDKSEYSSDVYWNSLEEKRQHTVIINKKKQKSKNTVVTKKSC